MAAEVPSTGAQCFQISSPQPHAEADAEGAPGLAAESEGVAAGATTVVPPGEAPALGPATNVDDASNIPSGRWKCLLDVPSFDPTVEKGLARLGSWDLGLIF